MPTFPNGSSVWISRFDGGRDFQEYGESVEEKEGTYTISCFIAAEKDEEWRVGYALALEGGSCMKLEVDVDQQRVTEISISEGECGYEKHLNGWQVSAWRLQRFTFGAIETGDTDEAWDIGHRKELLGSCIEVTFYGARVTGMTNQAAPPIEPQLADAIHPDSKAVSLVGLQVKTGTTEITGPVIEHAEVVGAQDGATRYVARFAYRPAKLLIAQGLMSEKEVNEKPAARAAAEAEADEEEEDEDEDPGLAQAMAASRAEARAQEARLRAAAAAEAEAAAAVEREPEPEPEPQRRDPEAEAIERAVPKPEPGAQEELAAAPAAVPPNQELDGAIRAKEEPDAAPPAHEEQAEAPAAPEAEPDVAPKQEPGENERQHKRQKIYFDFTQDEDR